jgi:hypothetical protein
VSFAGTLTHAPAGEQDFGPFATVNLYGGVYICLGCRGVPPSNRGGRSVAAANNGRHWNIAARGL